MKTVSPYMSAADLGIEDWERDGLIALIGPLSRDERRFDMRNPFHRCESACCIGGWVDHESWRHDTAAICGANKRPIHDKYRDLYFPESCSSAIFCSAPQAAVAIFNFLTTGDACWSDVMAGAR